MGDEGDVRALVESGRMAALGELTGTAAHEINNPLFAILTLVDFLLRDAEPGTKAYERLQLIEGSAKDIQAVVEGLHHFARERVGDRAPMPLATAAHNAVELVLRASATRSVEVIERYPAEPAFVTGDPARLKGLFVHLLVNAIQAMPRGGALTLEITREEGDVVARVLDEGRGIPGTDAERVFDLFYTSRNGGGTGLGLAAARAVAQLHGGTLVVDQGHEPGTCFVLRLPEVSG
jgi:two-component system, NtrC family, sensor kinase